MKRQFLSSMLGLLLGAAAITFNPAAAGEQPGPGLEIIDGATGIDPLPSTIADVPPAPIGSTPYQPTYEPFQQEYDTSTQPMVDSTWQNDPFAPDVTGGDVNMDDPFASDPDLAARDEATQPGVEASIFPTDPYNSTLDAINVKNPNFPGAAEAVQQRNLRGVADIVWQVVKERRIVDATLSRGPGASAGISSAHEVQMALDAINYQSGTDNVIETPMMAASRINVILDSFEQPTVEDPTIGSYMEQALVRLHSDIYAIRDYMTAQTDDALFLELSKTYMRVASTCDYFVFDRRALVNDINAVMRRSYPMFYPDGASVAGDVAGITGNMFQMLLMLDHYTRDDSWFRRDINTTWKSLELPARYVIDLACPDQSIPRFGPRGTRELWPVEIAALSAMFPKPTAFRVNRIGLAASHSYPDRSNQETYGGIYVTRSGPEASARYMAMRFGPPGDLQGVPPHFDFGSMVLMSRNIKYLVDAGGYGGEAATAAAHSVLSLDGQYAIPSTYNVPGEPVDAVWRTNASMDYLTDMAGFGDGKTWQRTLVYVKDLPGETRSDYWMILDHIDMKNDPQVRQARIRFQMAPGIQAHHDGSGIVASASYLDGSGLRIFAIDANSELTVSEGSLGMFPSHVYDSSGGAYAAPAVTISRSMVGDTTTATLLYPIENAQHRPARIERDSDIIRGRTGAIVIDHGQERIDVIAWAPPGTELVTPTLNLQLAADMAVFRIRNGKIARINFVNLERFQAKEPDGGIWSMRVNGPAQTLIIEPEKGGGWQVLSDPANRGRATFFDVHFGPAIARRSFSIRPGEMRVVPR